MIRLGILGSTRGSNLIPIIEAIKDRHLDAAIEIIISNKVNAPILEKASRFGIQSCFLEPRGLSREAFDQQVSAVLQEYHVDLVVLIGYMRILTPLFISQWKQKVINVHPSLLPAFAGLMDLDVHKAVLDSGVKETGCSVHYVTEDVDAGPIIAQKKCPVLPVDTPESLKTKVQKLEGELLVQVINEVRLV